MIGTTCKNCKYDNACIMYEPKMKRCEVYKERRAGGMNRNKYRIYLSRKKRHQRWLEKCETDTYECAIMRKIAQKEAVNYARAQADRWRHQ